MDLILYEVAPPTEPQARVPDSAANERWNVQEQASAWLRRVCLTVVPGLAPWRGRTDEAHG